MEKRPIRWGWRLSILLLFLIGNVLAIVSLAAELFGLDLTPGFGIVQMFQLLLGLTFLTLAGFLHLLSLREPGSSRSLQADIGIRLAATGLVFAYVSGLADLLGIGTHPHASYPRPFVGPLQLGGLVLGILSITIGLLLFYTSRGSRESSSLAFLFQKDEEAIHQEGALQEGALQQRVQEGA
ncbi:MAG: hypothetical protein R3272_05575 [Candidatus Promineifilaceae bacterium]|nr:hypothetical protein [Candidatus Promineifilaceae bacterium]